MATRTEPDPNFDREELAAARATALISGWQTSLNRRRRSRRGPVQRIDGRRGAPRRARGLFLPLCATRVQQPNRLRIRYLRMEYISFTQHGPGSIANVICDIYSRTARPMEVRRLVKSPQISRITNVSENCAGPERTIIGRSAAFAAVTLRQRSSGPSSLALASRPRGDRHTGRV
jgi:hypothetical protein